MLRQDAPFEFEIVVGEDRSTDGTLAIVNMLAKKYPQRIRVLERAQNLGAEKNFNLTISECRGEYIAFLEGDNYWTSNDKLRLQANFLDSYPEAAFCFHRAVYVDEADALIGLTVPLEDPPKLSGMSFLLQDFNPVPLGSMLVRRNLLTQIEDWVAGLMIGDWPICMMLANQGSIGFVPVDMSVQRVHRQGTWQLIPDDVKLVNILCALDHVQPRLAFEYEQLIQNRIHIFEQRLIGCLESLSSNILTDSTNTNFEGLELGANENIMTTCIGDLRTCKLRIDAMTKMSKRSIDFNAQRWLGVHGDTNRIELFKNLVRVRGTPLKAYVDLLKIYTLKVLSKRKALLKVDQINAFGHDVEKDRPPQITEGD